MKSFKKNLLATLTSAFIFSTSIYAGTPITLFNANNSAPNIPTQKIIHMIQTHFDANQYRTIKFQVINNTKQKADHVLVYLFSKKYHRMDVARMNIDTNYHKVSIVKNYRLTTDDLSQQPGIQSAQAQCPDETVQFISFAPNDDDFELGIANDVADAAEAHGLKTIRLMKEQATRTNYMNYMKCPRLKGNFYDGDANPQEITTYDGVVTYDDINKELLNQFAFKVTNIWLACEAYNDPMKTSMLDTAQTQKYAAGINDLLVGPSDKAAACTMKAALDNQPMTAAFQNCYAQLDNPEDQWGFGGNGSDYFGA
jgi:hypothetical protein